MKKKIIIIIYVFLSSFSFSYADMQISEIMYNPEGSDTNREWVEIYNNGSSSVDIDSWYFYENETYHGLYPDDFSSLAGGERALIVKDIATAKSELGSNLKYIKSSFSLNNTGESLALADSEKNNVDSYSYNVDDGANGDGMSLQNLGSSWTTGLPTPGTQNSGNNESESTNLSSNNSSTDNQPETIKKNYSNPYYIPKVLIPNVIVAQSDFNIQAEVSYVKEGEETRELDGYYYINFGDGNVIKRNKRIDEKYRYRNPGNYILVFEYYSSKLSFDSGNDPDAYLQKNINVVPHNLEIIKANAFDGIVIQNNTNKLIDLSSWQIIWNDKKYQFPRLSYLNSENKIYILYKTLGFSPYATYKNPIQLLSDAGKPVSYFPILKKKKGYTNKKVPKNSTVQKNELLKKEDEVPLNFENLDDASVDFFGNSTDSYLEKYLKDNPNKLKVDFGEKGDVPLSHKKEEETQNNSILYTLGAFILMLGAGRFAKYKNKKESEQKREAENFGSIEIIE